MALEDSTAKFLSDRVEALVRENNELLRQNAVYKSQLMAIASALESQGMKSFASDIRTGVGGLQVREEVRNA